MKTAKFKQGYFNPINTNKYIGNHKPRFLSSYELKFMRWADKSPNVVKWGSENIAIPYYNPLTRRHSFYLVDNFILLKSKNGELVKYLIEIKPARQTIAPTNTNRKNKRTLLYEQLMWAQNESKWRAAKQWADKHGCKFLILTEAELGIKSRQ